MNTSEFSKRVSFMLKRRDFLEHELQHLEYCFNTLFVDNRNYMRHKSKSNWRKLELQKHYMKVLYLDSYKSKNLKYRRSQQLALTACHRKILKRIKKN